ncbi:hypothetical protein Micbo1qcDRAFT_175164 [Microdochium bolleyi]|uniref:Uncharacterized protein n=1 Tax=Microdochium bolleyi TaxID=196109 RepID=A0A136J4R2_9PEZI|nr:hypothetical protein Micbo1qcDRAFT_175164 [Microdochium bolleyi]
METAPTWCVIDGSVRATGDGGVACLALDSDLPDTSAIRRPGSTSKQGVLWEMAINPESGAERAASQSSTVPLPRTQPPAASTRRRPRDPSALETLGSRWRRAGGLHVLPKLRSRLQARPSQRALVTIWELSSPGLQLRKTCAHFPSGFKFSSSAPRKPPEPPARGSRWSHAS